MDEDESRNAREERLLSESEKQVSEYDRIATLDAERPASQIEWWLAVRRSDYGELPRARAAARAPTATALECPRRARGRAEQLGTIRRPRLSCGASGMGRCA